MPFGMCFLPFFYLLPPAVVFLQKYNCCWREMGFSSCESTNRIVGQSLTTFTLYILLGKSHHFPPLLPKALPQPLPKAQILQYAPGEGHQAGPLFPNSFLSHSEGMLESPIMQASIISVSPTCFYPICTL